MKKILLLIPLLLATVLLTASELVMIFTNDPQELQSLQRLPGFTIHYVGNGFIVGTSDEELKKEHLLLDREAWEPGQRYYVVYTTGSKDGSYLQDIGRVARLLYQSNEMVVVATRDDDPSAFTPPPNGSMARIWNRPVSLPSLNPPAPAMPAAQDPFIVARMAEVDTALMHSNIQHLQDYGTRRCIKPEAILAQNWIKGVFEGYGLSTQLFDFTMPQGASSDNVIATKTGTLYPNEYVVIGGHYDSYTGGTVEPGADDNASGTCGILEVARILSSYTFNRTIIFCAFSGEEYGLYGSEAYAAWCQGQGMNIVGYLNMDMIGYLAPGDPIHTDIIAPSSAQWLVDYYTDVVNLYLPDFTTAPGALSGGDSDHTSFNNHGYMGIFPFEDSQNYSPYIHTSNDIIGPSVNNFAQVGVFTKAMVAATISLANMVPPQPVTIRGTITGHDTGLPLQGATVEVLGTTILSATTNGAGQYVIPNVQTGFQDLRISMTGYATHVGEEEVTTTDTLFNYALHPAMPWSFETGAFEPQWTFAGNLPWTITSELPYHGTYCARSGAIGDNQSSQMSLTLYLTDAGTVTFFRKVSSEASYDYLRFFIDGVQKGLWSGTVAWGQVNFQVTAGLHTFTWSYTKDANTIGGSDRAWVDYITFPPFTPPPDPADIAVFPAQFNPTITVSGTSNDLLYISNLGETALTFTAQVIYAGAGSSPDTVRPVTANYHTGTTTSSAKTQVSLVKGYPTTEAGWMKFDITDIPDGAIINSVEFHGYVNATYYPYWNINPVTSDPVTATPSVLYNDIIAEASSGYYLRQSESSSYSSGWKVYTLGGNAAANLQAALTQNWFAIGIMDRDASSSYYIGFDGWNEANKPYLVVSYTYTPPYSWLTLNGAATATGTVQPGSEQQIPVGFSAGALAPGSYAANIRITSNDPDEPQVMVPCTLTVSALPLTRTWTGAIDQNWHHAGNWNPEGVPGQADDVIIPPGVAHMPSVTVSGMGCNNLLIKQGATLVITPEFSITVNGNTTIEP